MEESRKYEPLRLKPCLRSYLWGGTRLREEYHKTGAGIIAESWELSVRSDGPTLIGSGAHCGESLADILCADPVGMAGTRCGVAPFPLLIKLIDAQKDLSVQVHPSDASACREKGEQGKTEMWYVVDCEPESTLFLGFSRAVTPDELRQRAQDGTICEVLNRVAVHPGDVFFVRPGTVHAIGAGILVAEIQQNSDTTFRVYDYNRLGADGKPRQLHLERAIEVMNCAPAQGAADTLLPCPPDGVQEVLGEAAHRPLHGGRELYAPYVRARRGGYPLRRKELSLPAGRFLFSARCARRICRRGRWQPSSLRRVRRDRNARFPHSAGGGHSCLV